MSKKATIARCSLSKMKYKLTYRLTLAVIAPLAIAVVAFVFVRLAYQEPPCSDEVYRTEESLPSDRSLVCHVDLDGKYNNLPAWVFTLSNLRTLNANGTNLQEVPAEIASLKRLEELNIAHDSLKRIDDALGKLKKLKRLYISGDDMNEFPLVITELRNLEELIYLSPKDTTRTPPELANLSRLRLLNLRQGDHRDFLTQLPRLQNLEELTIAGGRNYKLPEDIGNLTKLKSLSIQMIDFERFPASVVDLKELKSLRIGSSRFFDLPKNIGELKKLEELTIYSVPRSSYMVTSEGKAYDEGYEFYPEHAWYFGRDANEPIRAPISWLPESIGDLTNLRKLSIRRTKLDALPASMSKLSNLETLELAENMLSAFNFDVSQLTLLQTLDISANPIRVITENVADLPSLERLTAYKILAVPPDIHKKELITSNDLPIDYYVYAYQPGGPSDTSGEMTVVRQDVRTGDTEDLFSYLPDQYRGTDIAFDDLSQRIAYIGSAGLMIYDLHTKNTRQAMVWEVARYEGELTEVIPRNLKWSRGGKYISMIIPAYKGGSLAVYELDDTNRAQHVASHTSGNLSWAAGADRFVVAGGYGGYSTPGLFISNERSFAATRDISDSIGMSGGAYTYGQLSDNGTRVAYRYDILSSYDERESLILGISNADGTGGTVLQEIDCTHLVCTDFTLTPFFMPGSDDIFTWEAAQILALKESATSSIPVAALPVSKDFFASSYTSPSKDYTSGYSYYYNKLIDFDSLRDYYVQHEDAFHLIHEDADAIMRSLSEDTEERYVVYRQPVMKRYASDGSSETMLGESISTIFQVKGPFRVGGNLIGLQDVGYSSSIYDLDLKELLFKSPKPPFFSTLGNYSVNYIPLGFYKE